MKKFIEQIKTTKCFTGKNGQFTTHHSRLTKKLSLLVPQCLRASWIIRVRAALVSCSVHLNARKFLSNLVPQCLRAFTLAETLIVIGIIGVVAALTLPNLNHATGDKEKVTKVKKIYSALTEAFDRAKANYGSYVDEWKCNDSWPKCDADKILEFMKVSKVCGYNNEGCFSSAPMKYPASAWWWSSNDNLQEYLDSVGAYSAILSDGTSLAFYSDRNFDEHLVIRFDIDGPNKGNNMWGSDIFQVVIGEDKDECYSNWCQYNEVFPGVSIGVEYAVGWILDFGNLDYLKTDSEGKCNDNPSIILDGVNNTSCH